MKRHHQLKLREEFWDSVICGEKSFEIRINDRGFQKGDEISFICINEDGIETMEFSDLFTITYVLSGWGLKEGYVGIAIRPQVIQRTHNDPPHKIPDTQGV